MATVAMIDQDDLPAGGATGELSIGVMNANGQVLLRPDQVKNAPGAMAIAVQKRGEPLEVQRLVQELCQGHQVMSGFRSF
jgi:hypothetical protein